VYLLAKQDIDKQVQAPNAESLKDLGRIADAAGGRKDDVVARRRFDAACQGIACAVYERCQSTESPLRSRSRRCHAATGGRLCSWFQTGITTETVGASNRGAVPPDTYQLPCQAASFDANIRNRVAVHEWLSAVATQPLDRKLRSITCQRCRMGDPWSESVGSGDACGSKSEKVTSPLSSSPEFRCCQRDSLDGTSHPLAQGLNSRNCKRFGDQVARQPLAAGRPANS
jgi:hypothetical protein